MLFKDLALIKFTTWIISFNTISKSFYSLPETKLSVLKAQKFFTCGLNSFTLRKSLGVFSTLVVHGQGTNREADSGSDLLYWIASLLFQKRKPVVGKTEIILPYLVSLDSTHKLWAVHRHSYQLSNWHSSNHYI